METITAPAQEGTLLSDSHIGVPAATPVVHTGTTCQTVTEVLNRVGDKWSMQVVMNLGAGALRFNELRRAIAGISQRMLTRTLRGLERDGLVSRTVTPSIPPRVDYALTELGQSLQGPVNVLGAWAVGNREAIAAARERFDLENFE
ncbi:MAG: helix-turn-helix transcriptional regulator [Novosphingobium sp.]|nr:helix-turn-helix transcriptional regulator [Novosphingobium sp.]